MKSTFFIYLAAVLKLCTCQRGIFLEGDEKGIDGLPSLTDSRVRHEKGVTTSMHKLSLKKFKMSYFPDLSDIKVETPVIRVSMHGAITINDESTTINTCPGPLLETKGNIIAPFWVENTHGTVTYREDINDADKKALSKDISMAFPIETAVKASQIMYGLIITWNDMFNTKNDKRPQMSKNSFQLALTTLTTGVTYATFVYRKISYHNIHDMGPNTQDCEVSAQYGVGNRNSSRRFPLSYFFPNRPDWVAYYTNQENFTRLGRYTFKLTIPGGEQPLPPSINCRDKPVDPFCEKATWFGIEAQIHLEFCKFRAAGIYPYPLSCNRFVYCGVDHSRADVNTCMKGLNFNPILHGCDYKENVECNLPTNVTFILNRSELNLTKPPPQKHYHNNTCELLGWGDIADPGTCDHFLSCTNSRTIRRRCPSDVWGKTLYFQVTGTRKGYCDYRRNVKCVKGVRPTTPVPTTTTTTTTTTRTTTTTKNVPVTYLPITTTYKHPYI